MNEITESSRTEGFLHEYTENILRDTITNPEYQSLMTAI